MTGKHERVSGVRQALPYEMRLRMYHREKEELFYKLPTMTPAEIDAETRSLARKWRV